MTISFKPAKRENVPLLIGLDGASGSGKTYSALELATGISEEMARVHGGEAPIFGIDTERGRMLHYADFFRFLHGEIDPPFRPKAYQDALEAAERAGAAVVVVDSFSHEWEGEGGVREWADQLEAGGMKAPAQWKEPKLAHKRLVNKMLAMRPHIIVCLRSEEKMKVESVPQFNADGSPKMYNGKQSTRMVITPAAEIPVKERWVPICEKRFPFEITTSLLLTPQEPGVPIARKLQRQHQPFFPEGQRISREAGRQLAAWSMGGTASVAAPSGGGAGEFTIDQARVDIAEAPNLEALRDTWARSIMRPFREQLQPELDARKEALTPKEATDGRREDPAERAAQPTGAGDYDGA